MFKRGWSEGFKSTQPPKSALAKEKLLLEPASKPGRVYPGRGGVMFQGGIQQWAPTECIGALVRGLSKG